MEMETMKRPTFGLVLLLGVAFAGLCLKRGESIAVSPAFAASDVSAYSASWRITGPTGGDVRGLVVDPNDANRFYFGTLDGQLYTSIDAGHSWRLLTNFNRPHL